MQQAQDAAYRQIWQAFRATKRLADGRHDTPDWRARAGPFAVCCIRVPAELLQPELDAVRAVLAATPVARVHPDGFLHIALQELGFVVNRPRRRDEIDPGRLEEFTNAVQAVCDDWPPFRLAVGGVNSFQDAAFLEVRDGGRCARLHARLRELAVVTAAPRFAFLPHVTIAHYTGDHPAGDLPARLEPWRTRRFGELLVAEIEVATLRVAEPYPALEPYAILPLGE